MQPIGLAASFLWFFIPSAIFSWFILWWLPRLLAGGMALTPIFLLTFATPLALMLLAALVVYRREGNAWTWPAFRDRMRLRRMNGGDWLWTIGLVAGVILLGRLFSLVVGENERKSTWPGIIAHTIQNSAIPIMIAKGVLS